MYETGASSLPEPFPENLSVRSVVKSADRLIADQTTVGAQARILEQQLGGQLGAWIHKRVANLD